MLHRSLAKSAGYFWQPVEFENVANPYYKNINHFQNPGHLLLTKASIYDRETFTPLNYIKLYRREILDPHASQIFIT